MPSIRIASRGALRLPQRFQATATIAVTYVAPQWAKVGALAILLLGNIGLQLVGPLILRHFVDLAVTRGTLEALQGTALTYIAVAAGTQAVSGAETYVAEDVAWSTTNSLRADVAGHLLSLDMAFHQAHTPGELIERVDGDVSMLANLFSRFTIAIVGNALLLAGMLIVLWRVEPRVGLVLAIYTIVSFLALGRLRATVVPQFVVARQAVADLFGFLEERLGGTEDIRANGATDYLLHRLIHFLRRRLRTERSADVRAATLYGLAVNLGTLGTVVAFALAAYFYKSGSLSLGTAYLIFSYTQNLLGPLNQISDQFNDFQQARASLARIQTLLSTRPTIQDGPGVLQRLSGEALSATFDGVSFSYQVDELVLRDISFAIAPGTVLGILGRTGSSKTTMARLLFRLIDPDRGSVCLGGQDLRTVRVDDVRAQVALVTQEVQLFHATVRDNLTFFDARVPDARIVTALEELELGDWYHELPRGLDTLLASGGSGLSAGQAQLLALTRVFLADPGLVVLDEASSRLDPATEVLLDRAIDSLLRGRTGIIIAHRLATVQRADSIVVLENGQIVEQGPREGLAADPASRFSGLLRANLAEVS